MVTNKRSYIIALDNLFTNLFLSICVFSSIDCEGMTNAIQMIACVYSIITEDVVVVVTFDVDIR